MTMTDVTVFSSIILVLEIALAIWIAAFVIKKGALPTSKTWQYFAPAFAIIFSIYLFALGYLKSNVDFFDVAASITAAIRSFGLEIKSEYVSELYGKSCLFATVYVIAYVLALLSSLNFICSFFARKIGNDLKLYRLVAKKCDVLITDEVSARAYRKSYSASIFWSDEVLTKQKTEEYYKGMPFVNGQFNEDNLEKFFHRKKVGFVNFVCFEVSEDKKAAVIKAYRQFIEQNPDMASCTKLCIEIDLNQINTYEKLLENTENTAVKCDVSCFNRYVLLARRFEMEHPITAGLTDKHLDYKKGVVRDGVSINRLYVGFGRVNQELYRMSVMNNQLVTADGDKVKPFNVDYYAADTEKIGKFDSRRFNHYIKRIDRFKQGDLTDYFDMPYDIPKPEFWNENVESESFYNKLAELLSKKGAYTEIMVSFGSDFDNLDIAAKILEKLTEDNVDNVRIFVRLKYKNPELEELLNDKRLIVFGDNEEVLCNDYIVAEKLTVMAAGNNGLYFSKGTKHLAEDSEEMTKWRNLPLIKKYSNIYAAINLRVKLNLIGLDLVTKKLDNRLKKQDFFDVYSDGKQPNVFAESYEQTNLGEKSIYNLRDSLAFQEHLRWNATYLCHGYVPYPKSEITCVMRLKKDGVTLEPAFTKDNDEKRTHACLTTAEGLDAYHKHLVSLAYPTLKADSADYEQKLTELSTFKYDYQFMDSIMETAEKMGWSIVRKN